MDKKTSVNATFVQLEDNDLELVSGGYSGEDQFVVTQLLKLVEEGNEEQSIKLFNAYYRHITAEGAACFFNSFNAKFGYQMTQSSFY